ncbi:hypothetical protein [uncultured Megasphaera sp.]|uniref:hypothetical protein n=1 Tax=uncultured Megasphaera sp. TaxID=165188 RepID=UPI00265D5716|nr:hypothetical protein [uncultured Megasphaera sp.]
MKEETNVIRRNIYRFFFPFCCCFRVFQRFQLLFVVFYMLDDGGSDKALIDGVHAVFQAGGYIIDLGADIFQFDIVGLIALDDFHSLLRDEVQGVFILQQRYCFL